jgi:hypothetical protein
VRIYLAARFERRLELCGYRATLQAAGYHVTSRWLDTGDEFADGPRQNAELDVIDLLAADTLIAFTEAPGVGSTRGGRHVEFGIALGVSVVSATFRPRGYAKQYRILLVGPRESVFHHWRGLEQYDTWDQARAALAQKGGEIG